jgi:hypothetical protein
VPWLLDGSKGLSDLKMGCLEFSESNKKKAVQRLIIDRKIFCVNKEADPVSRPECGALFWAEQQPITPDEQQKAVTCHFVIYEKRHPSLIPEFFDQ